MNDTLDTFWSEYTALNYKNSPFQFDDFICSSKDVCEINRHIWNQNYSLPCTNVLCFVACRVTTKIIDIGSAEHSLGDGKTIKYGKRSYTSSDVSEKQRFFYTYSCIESGSIA